MIKKYIYCIGIFLIFASVSFASETDGTIVTGGDEGFAWSDRAGWANFGTTNGNIHITDSGITGYAWIPNYGWMNMNPANGGVAVSVSGVLSGYAWSSSLGWVNFSGVSINSSGKFVGQATGTEIGTLTFDCTNCSVMTDFRPSSQRTTAEGGGSSGGTAVAPVAPTATPVPTTPVSTALLPSVADTIPFTAEPTTTPSEEGITDAEGELLPDELFDIRLVIDRRTITSIRELVARTTFESFGRVPTPVDLDFSIVDAQGNTVYFRKDNVVIQTEGVLVTRFTDVADVLHGDYVLRLRTLYNVDVVDNFEIPFSISDDVGGGVPWIWILVGLFGATLAWFSMFLIRRRRCVKCRMDKSCGECMRLGLCNTCDLHEHSTHQMIAP